MKILVFGAKGFLGSTFIEQFENPKAINRLEDLSSEVLDNADFLINCAGASSVPNSFLNPSNDFQRNISLVKDILEKIRLSGNKNIRFVNLSSAAVYGNPQILPVHEDSVKSPISPYGFHKKMAEDICFEYSRCFGLKTISLRIFSAYGKGQKKMLLWDLHQKILNSHGEVKLYGTGEESRDFIHVDDIFQQLTLAMNCADFRGEAINVANGVEVKINKIAELYKKYHPISCEYEFNGENRPGDPLNWCADITRMKEWGYKQKVGIKDGVVNYITWLGGVNSDS